jgi:hypothetical protein
VSHLRGYDTTLMGLNLGALLTVSFMPLPTALLGSRTDPGDQFAVVPVVRLGVARLIR